MSWLFDRLTDLAVAERLEIRVDTEPFDTLSSTLRRAEQLQSTVVRRGCPIPLDAWVREPHEVRFVASDSVRSSVLLADLDDHDLGVAVAAHAPGASMKVDNLDDLSSLLEALITMRSYVQRIPN